jgi:hypothetical protein
LVRAAAPVGPCPCTGARAGPLRRYRQRAPALRVINNGRRHCRHSYLCCRRRETFGAAAAAHSASPSPVAAPIRLFRSRAPLRRGGPCLAEPIRPLQAESAAHSARHARLPRLSFCVIEYFVIFRKTARHSGGRALVRMGRPWWAARARSAPRRTSRAQSSIFHPVEGRAADDNSLMIFRPANEIWRRALLARPAGQAVRTKRAEPFQ